MSRTLIDIDDVLLRQAMEALGTTTKRATVNGALGRVVRAHRAEEHIRHLKEGAAQDLADPAVVAGAQR
ncbi:MAG: type II toxin-antitoxin system VapB family antitoxin [Bifidobacteriaceae bacterium]|jgi:Arc/MetJ family transcription regulator|nr:type II toxin-antitoxin system VapB family antitoxin [Bifidobacteriaceae bacterium]